MKKLLLIGFCLLLTLAPTSLNAYFSCWPRNAIQAQLDPDLTTLSLQNNLNEKTLNTLMFYKKETLCFQENVSPRKIRLLLGEGISVYILVTTATNTNGLSYNSIHSLHTTPPCSLEQTNLVLYIKLKNSPTALLYLTHQDFSFEKGYS